MPKVDWLITELNKIGGAEIFIRNLSHKFINTGWDVRVISLQSGGELVEQLRKLKVNVEELGVDHKLDVYHILKLRNIWMKDPPDLIHTHLYHASIAGRIMNRLIGKKPLVSHQHGLERNRSFGRTMIDRLTNKYVTHYVTSCQAVMKILANREKIPLEKISVIYNGIQSSNRITYHSKQIIFSDLNLKIKDETPLICCVGRLVPEKGQAYLIDAIVQLNHSSLFPHLVLIGEGPDHQKLREKVESLGIFKQVTFVGVQREIDSWLSLCDIFVLPSLWEGLSLALLEAMRGSMPIVTTNVGGSPEAVIHRQSGLIVPPGDADALATAIKELILNHEWARSLGINARSRVQENFSEEQTIHKTIDLYKLLLESKHQF